jgi:hypothetical protein
MMVTLLILSSPRRFGIRFWVDFPLFNHGGWSWIYRYNWNHRIVVCNIKGRRGWVFSWAKPYDFGLILFHSQLGWTKLLLVVGWSTKSPMIFGVYHPNLGQHFPYPGPGGPQRRCAIYDLCWEPLPGRVLHHAKNHGPGKLGFIWFKSLSSHYHLIIFLTIQNWDSSDYSKWGNHHDFMIISYDFLLKRRSPQRRLAKGRC